jgi:hypothetical protein
VDDTELHRYLAEGFAAVPEGLSLAVATDDGVHGFLDAPVD